MTRGYKQELEQELSKSLPKAPMQEHQARGYHCKRGHKGCQTNRISGCSRSTAARATLQVWWRTTIQPARRSSSSS